MKMNTLDRWLFKFKTENLKKFLSFIKRSYQLENIERANFNSKDLALPITDKDVVNSLDPDEDSDDENDDDTESKNLLAKGLVFGRKFISDLLKKVIYTLKFVEGYNFEFYIYLN